ncbi:MAG: dual specificity protein phosphatase family protein [Candidatus Altiarchaeota archaeon]
MSDLPDNFHWIINGRLAGSATPSVKELDALKKEGIDAVVSLQNNEEYDTPSYSREDLDSYGISHINIPVPDFTTPSEHQFREFIDYMQANPGKTVLVHCYLGRDRTGTMLAAYLGYTQGLDGYTAIGNLRRIWPKYIQNLWQEEAVVAFLKELMACCTTVEE